MNRAECQQLKESVIARHGPWQAYNIRLVDDVYTMRPGLVGPAELVLKRVVQLVADHARGPLNQLRVLDLGSHEGLYAVELARHGADVVAVEGRSEHVAKATFVKNVLGLDNLEVRQDDVRNLTTDGCGHFDVVLCLGILYHLKAPDVFRFVETLADLCKDLLLVETAISLFPRRSVVHRGRIYHGQPYGEEPEKHHAASLVDRRSFLLTRPSLLNLLSDTGFTSVLECHNPRVSVFSYFRDHVMLMARKGHTVELSSAPDVQRLDPDLWRWPEHLRRTAHPSQSLWYALLDRVRRYRGSSFAHRVFTKWEVSNDGDRDHV